ETLTPPRSLVLLPHSVTATTEDGVIKGAKVLASKKIRFYPENETAYEQALTLYRRCYNLAVEMINGGKDKDENGKIIDIRPYIRGLVEKEQRESGRIYNNELPNEAVREAKDKFKAVCKKNKQLAKEGAKSGYATLGFKSRKGVIHTFNFPKFPTGKSIAPKALGKVFLTEEVPAECFKKACKVTRNKGRWFLQVQQHIEINPEKQGEVKCVGVDQGVRTFLTTFSEDDALIIGENFAQAKLFPLMKQVDSLLSQKQKIHNAIKDLEAEPQWARDRLTHIERKINRLKCRKDDLILDMHNRAAYELVSRYDVIFLPTFESREMVRRKDGTRTIRRNTCRQMLDLCHYQFKQRLKWYAKKYGSHVADTNEAYTSKTRSWDGVIVPKLGGAKIIKGEGFTVDRDINGSRNTLIKNLSMAA
ncbi:transposase, partial [Vibrio sp. D431a]|uniref:transposase n=1 Tax=Vibrio sp. D431a TaxID=2837388 RepID=UPI0025534510